MSLVISLDAGTTGVRALAVDASSTIVGWSYREFTQYFPEPGWVEHDADEIWSAIETVIAELVPTLDEPIAAIGITDQRETVVAWDRRTGEPLHRAIVPGVDRCRPPSPRAGANRTRPRPLLLGHQDSVAARAR